MEKVRREVYQYTAFFDRDERGGYTVTVPALPGLVTEGTDLEQFQL
jgi:predicted RNase H-like HicB family nuclease